VKATEFCYWLQGAFELGVIPALTLAQLETIKKHLEMVKKTNQDDQPAAAVEFCYWLRGGADFIKHEDLDQTETVRNKLAICFEHTIDTLYPNQGELNAIHNKPGKNVVMRC
jgi:hypothetical protein